MAAHHKNNLVTIHMLWIGLQFQVALPNNCISYLFMFMENEEINRNYQSEQESNWLYKTRHVRWCNGYNLGTWKKGVLLYIHN